MICKSAKQQHSIEKRGAGPWKGSALAYLCAMSFVSCGFYQSYLKNSLFATMFPYSHCSDSIDSHAFIIILFITLMMDGNP